MNAKKIPVQRVGLLVSFFSMMILLGCANSVEYKNISSCPWQTWTVTFSVPADQIDAKKTEFQDSLSNFLGATDQYGTTCSLGDHSWTQIDKTTWKFTACISCKQPSTDSRTDTTAIRPPATYHPPAGLTIN